jgi:hypothetical protein
MEDAGDVGAAGVRRQCYERDLQRDPCGVPNDQSQPERLKR